MYGPLLCIKSLLATTGQCVCSGTYKILVTCMFLCMHSNTIVLPKLHAR